MGNKKIRKNYYKGASTTRCAKQLQRGIICFEVVAVIVGLTVMSFFFVLAHDFITQCGYFKADKIVVRGAHRLSEQQIFEHANIKKGINILSINLSIIRDRLLAHSWISEAEVRRELPNIITIEIKEHEPLAILELGRRFLINVNGEVFKEWTILDSDVLPIVSGLEFSDLNVLSKSRSTSFNAVMEILSLGRVPDSLFPNKKIRRINVDRQIGLTLYTFDRGREIKLGYHDYQKKYTMLENVLFYLKKERSFQDFNSIALNRLDCIVVNPTRNKSLAGGHKEV